MKLNEGLVGIKAWRDTRTEDVPNHNGHRYKEQRESLLGAPGRTTRSK